MDSHPAPSATPRLARLTFWMVLALSTCLLGVGLLHGDWGRTLTNGGIL